MLALAIGIALLASPRAVSATRMRASLGMLAALWALVGWAFLHRRYATINWAAEYYAVVFALEAAALALAALLGRRPDPVSAWRSVDAIARALLVVAVVAYPLLPVVAGRDWRQAEMFGLAPDPTAIGTLGALLLLPLPARRALATLPLVWCITSGLFLWPMRAGQAAIPLAAASAVIVACVIARRSRRAATGDAR